MQFLTNEGVSPKGNPGNTRGYTMVVSGGKDGKKKGRCYEALEACFSFCFLRRGRGNERKAIMVMWYDGMVV